MPWNAVHTQCEHHQPAKDARRGLAIAGVTKVHDGIGRFVPAGAEEFTTPGTRSKTHPVKQIHNSGFVGSAGMSV